MAGEDDTSGRDDCQALPPLAGRPMDANKDAEFEAFRRVVDGGYCIGCGACAARPTGDATVRMNFLGMYHAEVLDGGAAPDDFSEICPFSGGSANEDEIAADLFSGPHLSHDDQIGSYVACYAGHALEASFRESGSSGGLTSWLICALLESGEVDGVLHVGPETDDRLFGYRISRTAEDVRAAAKSRYYPVEMSAALNSLRAEKGRFAIVGVPCFVKAANLLRRNDPELAERITVTVGIFCGHMKSARFAEYLARQVGVAADEVAGVDFRLKYPDRPSYAYGFEAQRLDGTKLHRPMSEIYGNNWGYGFFKYSACNFCDDVTAETADVAFGDAWLPGFTEDPMGANVVVVRNERVGALLMKGAQAGRIHLENLSADVVASSQAAGLRDRREGLAYRLAKKDRGSEWRPEKRVAASDSLAAVRRQIYDLRLQISCATHEAFQKAKVNGSLNDFEKVVRPLTHAYDALYRPSALQRSLSLSARAVRKLYRNTVGRLSK